MIDVAIVGIGCRFPGNVRSATQFWEFLRSKGDGMVPVPADRWSLDRFYDPDPDAPGRMYVKQGGFLTQSLWDFDPEYFGISPREASIMDPQQRLVLEVAVEALDDAGLGPAVTGGQVGVYVGGFTNDNMVVRHTRESRAAINSHTATSGTFTMLSNRLSYVLDLHGPSMTIDTACSSSLVAIHEAAQAVARGECEVAIAGGVNAMLRPETFVAMCKGRFLAPDGRCKTFDASADGYARGEGAGMIVLKPLAQARADGDRVYAVLKSTGANQDGRTSGITVPNPVAQAALAARVLSQSGLAASDIGYVEAHGTGTSIGDPLEMQALGQVYGNVEGRHTPLLVGSVKASIGHTEAAAGVASVIKAALTIHHREIAPQAWLQQLNPAIPWDDYRVEVPTQVRAFPAGYDRAAAAVNGFGYGGTNAHVILTADDEASASDAAPTTWTSDLARHLLPLSGRTDGAVREAAGALADLLSAPEAPALDEVVVASWARRLHHPVRTTVAADDLTGLVDELRRVAAGEGRAPGRTSVSGVRPVFVFSGMGPQWWGMARTLLGREGAFATAAAEIDARFIALTGWSIVEELLRDEESSRVGRTEVAQPANFLVQVALVAELRALGIAPDAVVGHSVGEVSAAYVSGALSLDDALLVSYHRSRLQATTAGSGGMLAVGLPEADVLSWMPTDGSVSIAAVNSPSSVVLAGQVPVLEALAERLTEDGTFARALRVEVPYHSHLMDPILDDIRAALAPLTPLAPTMPLYSSVTSSLVTEATWGADYWVDNVREPVHFADTVDALVAEGHRVFLEIGPHPVLGGNIREILVRSGETGAVVPTLRRDGDDVRSLRQTVADLYATGALDASTAPGARIGTTRQVALPAYPWQRTRMWSEVDSMAVDRLGSDDARPMLGERTAAGSPEWVTELSSVALPWLPDHVVDGLTVLPGAAYLDMALTAARALGARGTLALADIHFSSPLVIDEHEVPVLRLVQEPVTHRFTIDSRAADPSSPWTTHVTGRIVAGTYTAGPHDLVPPAHGTHVTGGALYEQLGARGLRYGPAFQGIREASSDGVRLVASVDATGLAAAGHESHPATVDAALQCVAALVAQDGSAPSGPMVPYAMASVRRHGDLTDEVTVAVRRLERDGLLADIALADASGTVVLELLGVEFRPVRPEAPELARLTPLWYAEDWERVTAEPSRPSVEDAPGTLLVVVPGTEVPLRAQQLLDVHPSARLVTIASAPTDLLDGTRAPEVAAALADVIGWADGRITVAVVPPDVAGPSADAVAAVLATATAVQDVLDRGVLDSPLQAGTALERVDVTELTDVGDVIAGPDVHGVVVTAQAFGLPGDLDEPQLSHAALVGLRRTLRNEQPLLRWRLVDVEADTSATDLAAEVLVGGDPMAEPDEVALRGGLRLVTRFRRDLPERLAARDTATPLTDPETSFAVEAPASMIMSDLALREIDRVDPGPGEMEVRLLSAGLNYKDAGKVIGLLTDKEMAGTYFGTGLGMEAIARVVRVGEGVTQYAVGDRVSVSARNALRRYVTLDLAGDAAIDHAPTPWADTDSALILPFFTAHHALVDAVRVQPGETVLIGGAAGGVGLAAIQVAKRLGATVIGTASSPERRDAVLAAGADHALDSRSLSFVDEVHRLTDGRGVDVVLNSAPGEVIGAGLQVAAEFGRVVELGKSDIYTSGLLPLVEFDRNLSFHAIDIDRLFAMRRPVIMQLITTVFALFEVGEYVALPTTVYPVSQLGAAFDAVIRGSHIGRVVLDFTEEAPPVRAALRPTVIRDDAAYLVTGGFGDFGLATARWLVESGARHLVLAGRRGPSTVAAKTAVAALVADGVEVVEASLDVADPAAVSQLVARIQGGSAPLKGVFHAAGVLDDRPFPQIDSASLTTVLAPKLTGAWNLHQATIDAGVVLDHFVTYSSASAITGNVPQATYAAANTALDTLAHLRVAQGLAGFSVNWGALSGGMAGSSEEVAKYLATIGLGEIDMAEAARMLGAASALGVTQVGIIEIDWARWGATHPMSSGTPRFVDHVSSAGSSDTAALQNELAKLPEAQRGEVIAYMLAEQLAVVLGIPAESVDLDTALPDLGMDSLMAVEMQARVNLALGIEVSALEFGRGGGLNALAARVLPQLVGAEVAR